MSDTCAYCKTPLYLLNDVWVDDTEGDICWGDVFGNNEDNQHTPLSDHYDSITPTTTERKAMNTYHFVGTYQYIVQANSEDEAMGMMDSDLGEVLFEWNIANTHHEEG